MAQISIGGQAFVEAAETADFKNVTDGKIIYSIFDVRIKKINDIDTLVIASEVAKGPNAGVHTELETKFGKPEWPLMKYKQNTFKLTDEKALGALKKFINNLIEEPINASIAPAIKAMAANGNIDDDLLNQCLYAEDTEWKLDTNGEYWNLRRKKYIPVASAMGAKPGKTRPATETPAATTDGAHEGDNWG